MHVHNIRAALDELIPPRNKSKQKEIARVLDLIQTSHDTGTSDILNGIILYQTVNLTTSTCTCMCHNMYMHVPQL